MMTLELVSYFLHCTRNETGIVQAPPIRGGLSRKPLHIPLGSPLDILDHKLEGVKVQSRHRVEANIEENKGPLEEGIGGVSY